MIKILETNWESQINDPQNFIGTEFDTPLVQILPITNLNNPTTLMVGQDETDGRYYIVVEDNVVSEDIYLEENETLKSRFIKILDNLRLKDELLTTLYYKSKEANVEPVWEDAEGNQIKLGEDLIALLNDILERAYLPFIAEAVIDSGYRIED
jgi:hypothetical protein